MTDYKKKNVKEVILIAEIQKLQANEVLPIIKHNMRHLEDGNPNGNDAIQPELTRENYSLIEPRGATCKEINNYRKAIEKTIHKYNRKGLVSAVEIVVQRPSDLPPEFEKEFYQECHNFLMQKFLGGEEKFCFVSEVHKDEKHLSPTTGKVISHDHLHTMIIPAVRTDKYEGFTHKLSAHDLTSKKMLHTLHPELQAHLNSKGIPCTVYAKKDGDGKTIGLSGKQLKQITELTGVTIERSMTIDDLANLISHNIELANVLQLKDTTLSQLQEKVEYLQSQLQIKNTEIAQSKTADITAEKEKTALKEKVMDAEKEKQQLVTTAKQIISEKDAQISSMQATIDMKQLENQRLQEQLQSVQEAYKTVQQELEKEKAKVREMESKPKTVEAEKEHGWGASSSWGSSSGWGNTDKTKSVEVEL